MNTTCIDGNLVADPETVQVGDTSVTKVRIANNRNFKDSDGNKKQETCFIDVEAWGNRGTAISRFCKKGDRIGIEGRLVFQQWEKDGEKRSKHLIRMNELTFLNNGSGRSDDSHQTEEDGGDLPL